ncbi:tyrosine-protein phosphatase [Paenibacillus gansuensis]|uniref:Tyrosine-protein phosphatase n=1 Tax=Paenibacillus gansuensis TaxID=306542 RepID=A0ABW5PG87_9BACL
MIDIHTHILPGVDDGAQTLEASLDMVRAAAAEGISVLIATPHHANGRDYNEAGFVREQVALLNESIQAAQIQLRIAAGQEVRLYNNLLDDLEAGKLQTLDDSRYLLVELPSSRVPRELPDVVYELLLMGIVPIIAHPERNAEIAAKPETMQQLVDQGALGQVTTHSLLGTFGKKIQKSSFDLCRQNLIHFVSSDAHNLTHRPFLLQDAYGKVAVELGEGYVAYYKDNASRILSNQPVEAPHVEMANAKASGFMRKVRSWFS